ncbi:MAG TPA: SCO family protein [Dissulfurispiraceae bacterium]|nr:SCO family protein [Dissulfurispiraceae bacterium]
MKRCFCFIIAILVIGPCAAFAHTETAVPATIDVVAKTGEKVPLDIVLRDENGVPAKLETYGAKPAILALVYYTCDRICPQMLGALAGSLGEVKLSAGRDYRVLTVSFDELDTPAIAREKKMNYIKAAGSQFPEDGWRFLTGDAKNIERLTEAVGFRYLRERDGHGFVHPSVLIFLAPDGTITRYLHIDTYRYGAQYPVSFSPGDITKSLSDASSGKIWSAGSRNPLLICFPHMPENQVTFFTVLAGAGSATLLSMLGYFVYLKKKERDPHKRDA